MQIHLFQTDIAWEQPETNLASLGGRFDALAATAGDLVALPEMFSTGFSMAAPRTSEPRTGGGPATAALTGWARDTGCCVIGGVATRDGARFFNEALAAFPEGGIARYQKHQPFGPGDEPETFAAGERLRTFDWGGWCVGLTICYDLRFPEIYRALAAAGAELMVNVANWPRRRIDHWVALLRARAIENQCYAVGVNRVGEDPNSHYNGRSLVVDPHGEIVADGGEGAGVVTATLDLDALRTWRSEFPALADMRGPAPPVDHHRSPQ